MTHCPSFGHVGFPTKRHPLTGKAGGGLAMDKGVSWAWFDRSRMNFVVGWASGVSHPHLACKTGILVIYLIRAMIKPTGLSPLQVSIPPELELCPRSGTLQHAWSPFDLPLTQPPKKQTGPHKPHLAKAPKAIPMLARYYIWPVWRVIDCEFMLWMYHN